MTYALKERIGDPSLFCGRKKEMALLMNWVDMIPREASSSRALLGRRKSGKTAIMQRIFNILWNKHGPVVPFYFEVLRLDQGLLDFSRDYFHAFMSQYLSFQTRTALPLESEPWKMRDLESMGRDMGNDNVLSRIERFQEAYEAESVDEARSCAFNTPAWFASMEKASSLVMIDEMQYMTEHIYWDRQRKIPSHDLPGAFHGLVESKIAPMLVSGSYVGWMVKMIQDMFEGGRLTQTEISPKLEFDAGMEAVYRYAEYYGKTITDESAYTINHLTQSDPFYIATLFKSDWPGQDFASIDGAINTLTHEIKNRKGAIFKTWSEYIDLTMRQVNGKETKNSKKILLYLSKERYKDCTRDEIRAHLEGALDDHTLERKLKTLISGDLVTQGTNNFRYSGIPDDILDFIFRELYQEEIDQVSLDIGSELAKRVEALESEKESMQGALNELKGRMLEFIVHRELNRCTKDGKPVRDLRQRLRPISGPRRAEGMEETLAAVSCATFDMSWKNYYIQAPDANAMEVDVLAEGAEGEDCWVLVFEMKNRDEKNPPTLAEAKSFVTKVSMVKRWLTEKEGKIRFICPVYLSAEGFEADVEAWLHEQGVFTADMKSGSR